MDLISTASKARFVRGMSVEDRAVGGEGLARALDAGGTDALLALLDACDAVELEDGDVRVRVARSARGASLQTWWASGERAEESLELPARPVTDLPRALHDPARVLHLRDGRWWEGTPGAGTELVVPAISPEHIGSAAFRADHGVRYTYLAGAMAGGIASPELVVAMSRGGYLGFYGAGGLPVDAVRDGIRSIKTALGAACAGGREGPAGFNLLHNPAEPAVEEATVDLFLENGCTNVDASAYMGLTSAIVRYRLTGIREEDGRVVTPNRVTAKVSRPEVAEHFLRPAPVKLVEELVAKGILTARQAELARRVPMAGDITAEADSGGHTDRRPLSVLIPLFRRQRDRVAEECGYEARPRIGAAGGIGDPWSFAAALAMGADYVLTGSINQATKEAGTSPVVKQMLAEASYADVTMGPAPDMFEMGVQVQVLSRGTMYAQRAGRLYEIYRSCGGLDQIPAADREKIEKQILLRPIDDVWAETERYWAARDPRELDRANKDPRHKMALTFRWYLGQTSRWARLGESARKRDYQVWCGPAMGAFNDWVRGTWLEPLAARSAIAVSDAMVHGACVAQRVQIASQAGPLPPAAFKVEPVDSGR